MTKIDIYAVIPGVGEQTWTIWTAVDSWAYTKAEVDAGADKNKKENN